MTQETNKNSDVPHNAPGNGGPGVGGKNQVTECLKAKREEGRFLQHKPGETGQELAAFGSDPQ